MQRAVLFAAICLSLAAAQDGSEGHRIPLKMKRSSGYNKYSQYANRERNQQP